MLQIRSPPLPCDESRPELIRLARGAPFQEIGLILRPASRAAKKDNRLAGKTAVQPALTFQFVEGNKRTAGNRPFEKFLFGTDIHKKSAAIAEERHGLLRGQCFQHQKNRLLKSGATNGTQTKRHPARARPVQVQYHSRRRKVHPSFRPPHPSIRHETGHPRMPAFAYFRCSPDSFCSLDRWAFCTFSCSFSSRFLQISFCSGTYPHSFLYSSTEIPWDRRCFAVRF